MRAPLLCLTLLLGACHLVDQRSFVANADKPPAVPVAHALPPTPSSALVVIRFPAEEDWRSTLGVAVGLARARKPDVLFTVQSAVPRVGSPADQADAVARAAGDARAVADAIVSDGADRAQVELTAQADAGLRGEEIRIFVR